VDLFRLTHGEEGVAWIGFSSHDGNLVAQLETVFSVAPGILRKHGGRDVGVGNDLGGEGAIGVVGAEQKRLEGALGETVKERKNKENYGGPVKSDPQVLEPGRCQRERGGGVGRAHGHGDSRRILLQPIPDGSQACWRGRLVRGTDQLGTKRAKGKEERKRKE